MEREMLEVGVSTLNQESILITQPVPFKNDDAVVMIKPEQVDILIEWLQEAKAELEKSA